MNESRIKSAKRSNNLVDFFLPFRSPLLALHNTREAENKSFKRALSKLHINLWLWIVLFIVSDFFYVYAFLCCAFCGSQIGKSFPRNRCYFEWGKTENSTTSESFESTERRAQGTIDSRPKRFLFSKIENKIVKERIHFTPRKEFIFNGFRLKCDAINSFEFKLYWNLILVRYHRVQKYLWWLIKRTMRRGGGKAGELKTQNLSFESLICPQQHRQRRKKSFDLIIIRVSAKSADNREFIKLCEK